MKSVLPLCYICFWKGLFLQSKTPFIILGQHVRIPWYLLTSFLKFSLVTNELKNNYVPWLFILLHLLIIHFAYSILKFKNFYVLNFKYSCILFIKTVHHTFIFMITYQHFSVRRWINSVVQTLRFISYQQVMRWNLNTGILIMETYS